MEEKIQISILLSLYGKLLTKTQQKYMDLYYNEDLSLSEIGENENITRQAVRTISKIKKQITRIRKRLKIYAKRKQNKRTNRKIRTNKYK